MEGNWSRSCGTPGRTTTFFSCGANTEPSITGIPPSTFDDAAALQTVYGRSRPGPKPKPTTTCAGIPIARQRAWSTIIFATAAATSNGLPTTAVAPLIDGAPRVVAVLTVLPTLAVRHWATYVSVDPLLPTRAGTATMHSFTQYHAVFLLARRHVAPLPTRRLTPGG